MNPLQAFEIELPDGVDPQALAAVHQALPQIDGIDRCGGGDVRSADPASITVWVQLAAAMVTTVGAAVPVVKKVIELFKQKGIKGARLVLANGKVLELDEISVKDLIALSGGD